MKKTLLTIILSATFVLSMFNRALAADPKPGECGTDDRGQNVCALDNPLDIKGDSTSVAAIISKIIQAALGIIGALTLLMLVWGGFQWLTSAGNQEKVKNGTQTMKWAIIGVVLVFFSYVILRIFMDYLTVKK